MERIIMSDTLANLKKLKERSDEEPRQFWADNKGIIDE